MERVWEREREKERGQIDRWIHLLMQLCGYACACLREREYVEERKRERERARARTQVESWMHLPIQLCVSLCANVWKSTRERAEVGPYMYFPMEL